jgi:hypothetical protein
MHKLVKLNCNERDPIGLRLPFCFFFLFYFIGKDGVRKGRGLPLL